MAVAQRHEGREPEAPAQSEKAAVGLEGLDVRCVGGFHRVDVALRQGREGRAVAQKGDTTTRYLLFASHKLQAI